MCLLSRSLVNWCFTAYQLLWVINAKYGFFVILFVSEYFLVNFISKRVIRNHFFAHSLKLTYYEHTKQKLLGITRIGSTALSYRNCVITRGWWLMRTWYRTCFHTLYDENLNIQWTQFPIILTINNPIRVDMPLKSMNIHPPKKKKKKPWSNVSMVLTKEVDEQVIFSYLFTLIPLLKCSGQL